LKAVLFDFDGTLVDSYPAITASVNHVRGLHGLPPLPEDEVRRHVGRGPAYLLRHTVPAGDVEANIAAYREHHPSVLRAGTRLLPGGAQPWRALPRDPWRGGGGGKKPAAFTRELVAMPGIAADIALVLGPEDVARPKPASDMLLAALARLGLSAGEALY